MNINTPVWELLQDQIVGTGAEKIIADTNAAATLHPARCHNLLRPAVLPSFTFEASAAKNTCA